MLEDLLEAWAAVSEQQFDELVRQVEGIASSDNIEGLSDLAVPTFEATTELYAAMEDAAERGGLQIVLEAAEQGVELQIPIKIADWARVDIQDAIRLSVLAARARATADRLASGLCDAVQTEAMRLWGLTDIGTRVREFMDELSDRALRDELGGALHAAQNHGRFAVVLTEPHPVWYATEHLDRSACGPCKSVDGKQFESREGALAAYPNGGYIDCEGGVRCRGQAVPVWEA